VGLTVPALAMEELSPALLWVWKGEIVTGDAAYDCGHDLSV